MRQPSLKASAQPYGRRAAQYLHHIQSPTSCPATKSLSACATWSHYFGRWTRSFGFPNGRRPALHSPEPRRWVTRERDGRGYKSVPDASRITPIVRNPKAAAAIDFRWRLILTPGFEAASIPFPGDPPPGFRECSAGRRPLGKPNERVHLPKVMAPRSAGGQRFRRRAWMLATDVVKILAALLPLRLRACLQTWLPHKRVWPPPRSRITLRILDRLCRISVSIYGSVTRSGKRR